MNIQQAALALVAAAQTVDRIDNPAVKLKATRDAASDINGPFVLVAPPSFRWEGGHCAGGPTEAIFPVIVVDDHAKDPDRLIEYVSRVAQAIEEDVVDAAVTGAAEPAAYAGLSTALGSENRPSYVVRVAVALN